MVCQVDKKTIDVLYAEDQVVFQDIFVQSLEKCGFPKENIQLADDGADAIEVFKKLQEGGDTAIPILVVLDVRMPNMDGNECAKHIGELAGQLPRCRPFFMVRCSAGVKDSCPHEDGDFMVTLPKPFCAKEAELCLDMMRRRWCDGSPSAPQSAEKSVEQTVDVKDVDIIVADPEPICAMAIMAQLAKFGFKEDQLHEIDDPEDFEETVGEVQAPSSTRPLLVFLGTDTWMNEISSHSASKPIFVVCVAVDTKCVAGRDSFQAVLPKTFQQAELQNVLESCQSWWHNLQN